MAGPAYELRSRRSGRRFGFGDWTKSPKLLVLHFDGFLRSRALADADGPTSELRAGLPIRPGHSLPEKEVWLGLRRNDGLDIAIGNSPNRIVVIGPLHLVDLDVSAASRHRQRVRERGSAVVRTLEDNHRSVLHLAQSRSEIEGRRQQRMDGQQRKRSGEPVLGKMRADGMRKRGRETIGDDSRRSATPRRENGDGRAERMTDKNHVACGPAGIALRSLQGRRRSAGSSVERRGRSSRSVVTGIGNGVNSATLCLKWSEQDPLRSAQCFHSDQERILSFGRLRSRP